MKETTIKSYYAKIITLMTFLLLGLVFGIIFLEQQNVKKKQELALLTGTIGTLNQHIVGLRNVADEFKHSYILWKALFQNKEALTGLKIQDARAIMDKYKDTYHISTMDVNLSKPVDLSELLKDSSVEAVSTEVTIVLKALTDEHIFSFIRSVTHELPGYIQVKSLRLTKDSEVINDALLKISEGAYPPLVECEWIFYWRDVKMTENAPNSINKTEKPSSPAAARI